MEILRLTKLSLLSILLLLSITSWRATATSDKLHGDFLQCLLSHSQPSHPISPAIFTPKNSSYSSVLQAYIRNLRFNTNFNSKPLLIITALHESHIQIAIIWLQNSWLPSWGLSYSWRWWSLWWWWLWQYDEKIWLTVDHVVDAKVIDVNGRLVDRKWAKICFGPSEEEQVSELFAYKINLVRVPETVTVFRVNRTLKENGLRLWNQWQHVADKLPEELFIRLVLDVVNSTRTGGRR
ncbi:FAD-binding Berberine family protein [Melia azedarach]|uniref:FAD-binding Berberine family protein n=1 Tax=Melia azedarach TaxID=155640 RepID=A0ACC1WUP2_MELAZ|nr:FAD-binding Berberine family protein [Melia azedarach]